MAKRKRAEIVTRKIVRGVFCEVRCEVCLGKPQRCGPCEKKVQAFYAAVGVKPS